MKASECDRLSAGVPSLLYLPGRFLDKAPEAGDKQVWTGGYGV
jgi:hypothetical protein